MKKQVINPTSENKFIEDFKMRDIRFQTDLSPSSIDTVVHSILHNEANMVSKIEKFSLANWGLKEFPESICNFYNLKTLSLQGNRFTALPESIGNLKNLQTLYLYSNDLISLPENIGSLTSLRKLYLNKNQLTALPDSIGNLDMLYTLDLSWNKLVSLPETIGKLSNLWELYLLDNKLTSLPDSVGNLKKLEKFYLHGNNITSLPKSIGDLVNLQVIDLDHNELKSLPDSIGNLKKLQRLDLSLNGLSALPDSIGNLSKLRRFNLYHNGLTSLPETINKLKTKPIGLATNPISYQDRIEQQKPTYLLINRALEKLFHNNWINSRRPHSISLEKGIEEATTMIISKLNATSPIVVSIAGGSSSGKTSVIAKSLHERFATSSIILPLDSYPKRSKKIVAAKAKGEEANFDEPDAFNLSLARSHIISLKSGEPIDRLRYDYEKAVSSIEGKIFPADIIIFEGLFTLRDELVDLADIRIFVDASLADRRARRLLRDSKYPGLSTTRIKNYFDRFVQPMHEKFVEPTRRRAHIIIQN